MDSLIQEITQKENEYLSPTKKLCQAIQLSILEKCLGSSSSGNYQI